MTSDAINLQAMIRCHECDLVVTIGTLQEGQKAQCPRCDYVISRYHKNALDRMLVFSLTSLFCFLLSLSADFITLGVQGQQLAFSFVSVVKELLSIEAWALSVIVLVVVMIVPLLMALAVSYLVLTIKLNRVSMRTFRLLRVIDALKFWNMVEIYFLGMAVSMVKVVSMATLAVGASFWAFLLFNLFLVATLLHFDRLQLTVVIKQQLANQPLGPEADQLTVNTLDGRS